MLKAEIDQRPARRARGATWFAACAATGSLACWLAAVGMGAELRGAELSVQITEVKGQFCKFALEAADGEDAEGDSNSSTKPKSGDKGKLRREAEGPAIAEAVITSVQDEYAVAKVTGAAPQVGDWLVLGDAEEAKPATTEKRPKSKDAKTKEKAGPQKTKNQRLAEIAAAKAEEERKRWEAVMKTKGVELWPELTSKEHSEAVEKHKKMIEEIKKIYPGIALYETEQFLFCSNIPPDQVGPYVVALDAMHAMMCKQYNIKDGTRVWKGKALVVAFLNNEEFVHFEKQFMSHDIAGASVYGLCHQEGDGDVVMACYRGDQKFEFGQMLVHETSHGFIHRYKTPVHFPSWVNEGMADYIGQTLVPASTSVKRREKSAHERMKQSRTMGGDFFTAEHIDAWQYGVASSLTAFMIRTNPKAYVDFIEGMKAGLSWEESLKEAYKATPEELVMGYGRALGIPDLRP